MPNPSAIKPETDHSEITTSAGQLSSDEQSHSHGVWDTATPWPDWCLNLGTWALGPVLIAVMFHGVVLGQERFAFRDVDHFYTPLYQFVHERCVAAGPLYWFTPLWNDLDQTGMPLAGETTTALFYPIRDCVYRLAPDPAIAMGWYVVLHLIIASLTIQALARNLRLRRHACLLASILYPLSGSILFLATNPPFLVSASWLPLVFCGFGSRVRLSWALAVVVPAMALALMVLGGDPQTALHAVIATGVLMLRRAFAGDDDRGIRTTWGIRVVVLGKQTLRWFGVALLAGSLCAPQLLASCRWAAQSERMHVGRDMSLTSALHIDSDDRQREASLGFSVGPWRWAELLVGNLYGTPWPQNDRWDRLVFRQGQTDHIDALWTPTVYGGFLMVPLLLVHRRRKRKSKKNRGSAPRERTGWGSLACFAACAALGAYGPMYCVRFLGNVAQAFLDATGMPAINMEWMQTLDGSAWGPYWALWHFLPGYDAFRYPSKWLTLFTLGTSMAVAVQTHHLSQHRNRGHETLRSIWQARWRIALGVVSVGMLLALWLPAWLDDLIPRINAAPDPWWGPVQPDLVRSGLQQRALGLLAAVAMLLAVLGSCHMRWISNSAAIRWVVALMVVELSCAHWRLIPVVNCEREQALLEQCNRAEPSKLPGRWLRRALDSEWPKTWARNSAPNRLLETSVAGRTNEFGRWHLIDDIAVFNSMRTLASARYQSLWPASNRVGDDDQLGSRELWRIMADRFGIRGEIHLNDRRWKGSLDVDPVTLPMGRFEPYADRTDRTMQDRSAEAERQVTLVRGSWDWGTWMESLASFGEQRLFVETSVDRLPPSQELATQTIGQVGFSVIDESPQGFVIDIETRQATWLVRHVFQDGHWTGELQSLPDGETEQQRVPILRADGLCQAMAVPAGRWRLRVAYEPDGHGVAVYWCIASWLAATTLVWAAFTRARPSTR
ncbi:MAG: hypothetical protein AAGD07_06585 [Planctomycetota bacterium]